MRCEIFFGEFRTVPKIPRFGDFKGQSLEFPLTQITIYLTSIFEKFILLIYNNKQKKGWRKMAKTIWKPGTFIYPIPAVMVSCGDMEKSNIITVAWTGILNTNPAMCYISVRPERYSYNIIKETGEFVINLTTKDLAYATDWCGVKSGKNFDKFKEMKLTKEKSNFVKCPAIKESPVSVECRVKEIKELRKSHYVYGGGIINKCR